MANGILVQPMAFHAISAPSAMAAGWPVDNLALDQPRAFAEATGASLIVDVDLGTAREVDTVALLYTNAVQATTWEIRRATTQGGLPTGTSFWSDNFWAGPAAATVDRPHGLVWRPAATSRWWRVTVTNPSAPVRAGRLVLGKSFQAGWNFQQGMRLQRVGGGRSMLTDGGARVPSTARAARRLQVAWADLTDAEYYDQLDLLDAYAADGRGLLFVRDPDVQAERRHEGIVWGHMTLPQGGQRRRHDTWRAPVTIEEMT